MLTEKTWDELNTAWQETMETPAEADRLERLSGLLSLLFRNLKPNEHNSSDPEAIEDLLLFCQDAGNALRDTMGLALRALGQADQAFAQKVGLLKSRLRDMQEQVEQRQREGADLLAGEGELRGQVEALDKLDERIEELRALQSDLESRPTHAAYEECDDLLQNAPAVIADYAQRTSDIATANLGDYQLHFSCDQEILEQMKQTVGQRADDDPLAQAERHAREVERALQAIGTSLPSLDSSLGENLRHGD